MAILSGFNLKNILFLNKLTSEEILFIAPYLENKIFNKGEIILPQGSRGGDLYLVISGLVSVDIVLPGDYKKDLTTLGEGQVFGEVTFLSNSLVTARVLVLESCNCLIFYSRLLDMLRIARPEIAYKIEREIATQTEDKIISNMNSILELLNTIPESLRIPSSHALYLENKAAETTIIEINDLDKEKLRQFSFFKRLNEEQILRLFPLMRLKIYDKGYRFLEKQMNINHLGLILSGAVMLFIKENNQLKKSIAVSGVGELFLQNFIFAEFRKVADYITCEKSVILELDIDVYKKLHDSDPDIFYAISEAIYREMAGSVYIVNRQFVRINSEYNNILI